MDKTEALATLCRNNSTSVKCTVPSLMDGQLKSALSDHHIRFFQLMSCIWIITINNLQNKTTPRINLILNHFTECLN